MFWAHFIRHLQGAHGLSCTYKKNHELLEGDHEIRPKHVGTVINK